MADALCGPSNALSTFQKHSSVDRTLQQDRLVAQRSQEQGFRSAPGPNAGLLDAEFEAFQAGAPSQFQEGFQQNVPIWPGHTFQPPQQQLSEWASDFQNMNLNDFRTYPVPPSQSQRHALSQPSTSSMAWHQEFLQEPVLSQTESRRQTPQQPFLRGANSHLMAQYPSVVGTAPLMSDTTSIIRTQDQHSDQETDDDALFEKHFAAAALEVDHTMGQAEAQIHPINAATSATTHENQAFDPSSLLGPSIQRDASPKPVVDAGVHDPIGSDTIPADKGKGKEAEGPSDADELARTAGTLLESVKHDQSQKFKQSNFLSLMRQLRDREVRVEGEKFVNATQPLHPGGDNYPSQEQYREHGPPVGEQENPAAMGMWEQWSSRTEF